MEILSNKKQKYGKQSAGIKKFRRHPYLQGIFESLSMQENLRVNRFTLVETFLLEVNVKVSNFYQFMSEFIP